MAKSGEFLRKFRRRVVNPIYVSFLSAYRILLCNQPPLDTFKGWWGGPGDFQMVSALLTVVDYRPDKFSISPTGSAAKHHVILDETMDHLAEIRQSLKYCLVYFFYVEKDCIPTSGEGGSNNVGFRNLFPCIGRAHAKNRMDCFCVASSYRCP